MGRARFYSPYGRSLQSTSLRLSSFTTPIPGQYTFVLTSPGSRGVVSRTFTNPEKVPASVTMVRFIPVLHARSDSSPGAISWK
jgi:hypothetical protein